ncbi:phage holin family protein [Peribacillus sp. JNUCC 23]
MERLDVFFKVAATLAGGVTGYLFGGWEALINTLLVFVAIDYLSGLIASAVEGKLSSKIGFRGIAKKVMIFAIVAVAHLIDRVIGENDLVRDAAIYFYMANELLSIIENAGRTGLIVPEQIKGMVQVLKGKAK